MAQISRPWEGTTVGDAGAYSSDVWSSTWKILYSTADNEGVIDSYLNELEVLGITGGVKIKSGAALVNGTFYENTSAFSIELTNPVTNPKIDVIAVEKNWGTQEIRVVIIEGEENASPTAETLTQESGAIWQIPLAEALITTGGIVTVTSTRDNCDTPLTPPGGLKFIQEVELLSDDATLVFSNIPQRFQHLLIKGVVRSVRDIPVPDLIRFWFNNDSGPNYSGIETHNNGAVADGGSVTSLVTSGGTGHMETFPSTGNYFTAHNVSIPNYRSSYFKTIIGNSEVFWNGVAVNFQRIRYGYIWVDTSPITDITVFAPEAFLAGSKLSLYGV